MGTLLSALFASLLSATAAAHPFDHLASDLASRPDLTDVSALPGVELDLRYATTNNFTRQNVYGPFHRCFLHRQAAPQLKRALEALRAKKPLWKLRVLDCLRPVRAQARLFEVVRGTPEQKYVLSPAFGSLHSYGFAIDLTLSDESGREVDMGTPFDFFGIEAEPAHEAELLREGRLSQAQYRNRLVLREAMREAGFRSISSEWWHFDAQSGAVVRGNYEPVP